MYTEISHFLLLLATFIAGLWFICLAALWCFWISLLWFSNPAPAKYKMSCLSRTQQAGTDRTGRFFCAAFADNRFALLAEHSVWVCHSEHIRSDRIACNTYPVDVVPKTYITRFIVGTLVLGAKSVGCDISNVAPLIFCIFFFIFTCCFFGTISNYVCSDFTVYNILTNSTADVPLFYKISATWSNHEGSLLLWCWLLSFNTFLFGISICTTKIVRFSSSDLIRIAEVFLRYRRNRQSPKGARRRESLWAAINQLVLGLTKKKEIIPNTELRCERQRSSNSRYASIRRENRPGDCRAIAFWERTCGLRKEPIDNLWMTFFRSTASLHFYREEMQRLITITAFTASIILIFFTTFCVGTSNPFLRTSIPSINSLAELNPILQDPVLAIHPPCIYVGYVASAIAFSICMSSFYNNPR